MSQILSQSRRRCQSQSLPRRQWPLTATATATTTSGSVACCWPHCTLTFLAPRTSSCYWCRYKVGYLLSWQILGMLSSYCRDSSLDDQASQQSLNTSMQRFTHQWLRQAYNSVLDIHCWVNNSWPLSLVFFYRDDRQRLLCHFPAWHSVSLLPITLVRD